MGAVRVEAMYIAPVKSLALLPVERGTVGADGIAGDRRFFLVGDRDRLVSQRECAPLVQVRAAYGEDGRRLRLTFPDGRTVEDGPADGAQLTVRFFGQFDVEGYVVEGPWAAALSAFTGMDLRLVRAATTAFDTMAISICSAASVAALREHSAENGITERRFRPNFYISGVGPHGEDEWIGRDVRIGGAVVRVRMRDPRCVITTHNPDTGETDINTLRMITAYRTDQPKEANFGVYGTVKTPGGVRVGDEISVV